MPPAESVRIRALRPRRWRLGSWARASLVVVMWSAAVLLPALPGRSSPATGSPEPLAPWSTNTTSGWCPKVRGFDQAGNGGVGGHRPEEGGYGPQHGHVRQAVPAQCHRQGEVQQHLVRIVHRTCFSPGHQRHRYRGLEPGLAGSLCQQHPAGLRDHHVSVALDTDRQVGPETLVHLESASFLATDRTLEKSHRCWSAVLSNVLIKGRTGSLPVTRR